MIAKSSCVLGLLLWLLVFLTACGCRVSFYGGGTDSGLSGSSFFEDDPLNLAASSAEDASKAEFGQTDSEPDGPGTSRSDKEESGKADVVPEDSGATDSSESLHAEAETADDNLLYAADGKKAEDSPGWLRAVPEASDEKIRQILVVSGDGLWKATASVSLHERDQDGVWKQILMTSAYIGRNGLCRDADHWEGCGKTPMGTYHFNKAFGIAKDPGCSIPYKKVNKYTYWSGDMRKGMHYNEMVDIRDYPGLDLTNSEHLIKYSPGYRYCLNISFNDAGTAGRGSAIFLHCFFPGRCYTSGCVSVAEDMMKLIMQRVRPDCAVVIDTKENLERKDIESAAADGVKGTKTSHELKS